MGFAQPAPTQPTATPALHVLPPPATTTPAAAPAKKRGLNLGGIGAAAPAAKGGKTYPVADLTDEQKEMVSDLLAHLSQIKAMEGSVETWKKDVNALVLP